MDSGPITETQPPQSITPIVNTVVKSVKDELGVYYFIPIILVIIFLILNIMQTGLLLRLLMRE